LELHTILTAPQCFKLHLPALNSTLLSSLLFSSLPLPYYVSLLPNSSHFSSSKPNPETEAQIPTQKAGLLTLYYSPRMNRNKKEIKSAAIIHQKTEAVSQPTVHTSQLHSTTLRLQASSNRLSIIHMLSTDSGSLGKQPKATTTKTLAT